MADRAMDRGLEWLISNGAGGFACGTYGGQLTRKWHHLLVAARRPPRDRVPVLSGIEERLGGVVLGDAWHGGRWHTGAARPVLIRRGVDFIQTRWELDGGGSVERILLMPRGRNELLVRYRVDGPAGALVLRPVLPFPARLGSTAGAAFDLGGVEDVCLHVACHPAPVSSAPAGPLGEVDFAVEHDCERIPTGGRWAGPAMDFGDAREVTLAFGLEPPDAREFEAHLAQAHARDAALPEPKGVPAAGLRHDLAIAADQFIVKAPGGGYTILAGYPWFTDWGRDTAISLPGLCLRTGRMDAACDIVEHFLRYLDGGIIPNLFPEADDRPMYNTVDATLWLVHAMDLIRRSGGAEAFESWWPKLRAIVEGHLRGTHNDTRVDADGLLRAGGPGTQLTWMDVKVNGEVPTPRHGKAVEIQGLWYNALLVASEEAQRRGERELSTQWRAEAERCRSAFRERFVVPRKRWLADVVDRDGPGTVDARLRPNQALPFALAHSILPEEYALPVLQSVASHLATPRGLRTLDPAEPEYKPRYRGELLTRDRAYHQGTVWMWLAAPFAAGLRQFRTEPWANDALQMLRAGALEHFEGEGCVGQASEIFDAQAPHHPRGCFGQAWSVAATVKLLDEN